MSMPEFAAEASLYRTRQFYRGTWSRSPSSGGPAVVAQLDCSTKCFLEYGLCTAACAAGGGFFCLPGCFAAFLSCQDGCGSGGGGVGGGGTKGTHCTVHDPNCSSGFSKLRCPTFDPDDCIETGICCTPTVTNR